MKKALSFSQDFGAILGRDFCVRWVERGNISFFLLCVQ
jgi:hypothetical protein